MTFDLMTSIVVFAIVHVYYFMPATDMRNDNKKANVVVVSVSALPVTLGFFYLLKIKGPECC